MTSSALRARRALALVLLGSLALTPGPSLGAPSRSSEAKTRFERALKLYDEKDFSGALAEFSRANELSPSSIVLYDIAQCYEAMGRPVDAKNTLTQLIAGGPSGGELSRAKAMLQRLEQRIGTIVVEGGTPGAQVEIDGLRVGTLPLSTPLSVASGARILTVVATGFAPYRTELVVAAQAETKHAVKLLPTESRLAHLEVKANVSTAQVRVAGQLAGATPLPAPLTLLPGVHELAISRPGYRSESRTVTLGDGAAGSIDVVLREAPGGAKAHVDLEISEPSPIVFVDDEPRGTKLSLDLPEGVHRIRIEHAGFLATERDVTLDVGSRQTIQVRLVPTAETRESYESSVRRRKIVGWSLVIGGAVVGGAGAGLAIASASSVGSIKSDIDSLNERISVGSGDPCSESNGSDADAVLDCKQERASKEAKLSNTRTRQTIGIIGASVGGAALIGGVIVLLTTPSAKRFEMSAFGATVRPVLSGSPGGGFLGAAGTF